MQKDNEIRTLRAQHKQKEMILKRKQEEVRYTAPLRLTWFRNVPSPSYFHFISF